MQYRKWPLTLLFLIFAFLLLATVEYAQVETEASPSLHDGSGGGYSNATAVDDFIERMFVDDN